MSKPLRVRFAPSPTGALHIGGARTALYNWLAARGNGGALVLRIEDTDRERSTAENVAQILDALSWLGLDWDEGPHSQFERRQSHATALERLLDTGAAYRDHATAEDVREWKAANANAGYRGESSDDPAAAIRLRVPAVDAISFDDAIRGRISFPAGSLDDPVIARSNGSVLYNFAVAIDDAEMRITQVIRGDDHISNTPKQLMVFEALGIEPPAYAHLPLLHGTDGKKLSKRHGAASVQELRRAGFLPAALRNYLALLGWGADDDATLIATEQLIERFSVDRVGKAAAVFDERKLRWINGRYMRGLSPDDYEATLAAHLAETDPPAAQAFAAAKPPRRRAACQIVQDKAQVVTEIWPLVVFLFTRPEADEKAWAKVMTGRAAEGLAAAEAALSELDQFNVDQVEATLRALSEREGLKPKELFQPIRVAITGGTISPGIFESVAVLGREAALERIAAALARLRAEARH